MPCLSGLAIRRQRRPPKLRVEERRRGDVAALAGRSAAGLDAAKQVGNIATSSMPSSLIYSPSSWKGQWTFKSKTEPLFLPNFEEDEDEDDDDMYSDDDLD